MSRTPHGGLPTSEPWNPSVQTHSFGIRLHGGLPESAGAIPSEVKWIEVDLPGIIDFKNEALSGERPTCSVDRIGLDIADPAANRDLLGRLHDPSKSVLIVTEVIFSFASTKKQRT